MLFCSMSFQKKLAEFEAKVSEERKKRLYERKEKRKEERRQKWIQERAKEEKRRKDEQFKRGIRFLFHQLKLLLPQLYNTVKKCLPKEDISVQHTVCCSLSIAIQDTNRSGFFFNFDNLLMKRNLIEIDKHITGIKYILVSKGNSKIFTFMFNIIKKQFEILASKYISLT